MKTQQQVLDAVKAGRKSKCIDGRDYERLVDFFPASEWEAFGFAVKEGIDPATLKTKPWTPEAICAQLAGDLAFAFEKALGKRGISASTMYSVVKMWLWVLDDDLQNHNNYAEYGLPLLKAVALKYNLPNPIGDEAGNEDHFG